MIKGELIYINGDGETSRDFCFIDNAVQANLLAAVTQEVEAVNQVYNVAVGDRTTLNTLFNILKATLATSGLTYQQEPVYRDFRSGDVRHSQADLFKSTKLLRYQPVFRINMGITSAMPWYIQSSETQHHAQLLAYQ
jgi:UDP-N-acetylglucosamine 4-epimerase